MNKIKKLNKLNLLKYQHFLKNNSLKKQKFKLKNILFDNPIIYKEDNLSIIEINNSKNISIPLSILNFNRINTIKTLYENQILFNYNLTNLKANILYNFNKIVLNYMLKKTDIIKGKIVHICTQKKNKKLNKKLIIAILGINFPIKSKNLNKKLIFLFRKKKKLFFKEYNRNKFYQNKKIYIKKKKEPLYKQVDIKIKRLIRAYQCKDLNFKIIKLKDKYMFSRISYVNHIIKLRKKQIRRFKKEIISGKISRQLKTNLLNTSFVEPIILKKKN